jgi:hypothetical protein
MRDPREEDIRTMYAEEGLMYGNLDKSKKFPFDVRARFKYVVFSEKLGRTEDGQVFSKKTSQRFSFFTPEVWEELVNEPRDSTRKNYFERKGLKFTILHDPFIQAKLEGKNLKTGNAKRTGLSLEERLAKVKSAEDFGQHIEVSKTDQIEAEEIEVIGEESQEKKKGRPANRK